MTVFLGGGSIGGSLGYFMNILDAPPCQVSAVGPQDPTAKCYPPVVHQLYLLED